MKIVREPLFSDLVAFATAGNGVVIGRPGAGKTFCLIARIDHLIRVHGLDPHCICAVTFTNKAAEEVALRLRHTIGERA